MRNAYNVSCLTHLSMQIGRIQTVGVWPIVAGDSIELNLNGIFRLASTRKEIVSECQVDIMAFFVKHRHAYPNQWTNIVTEGQQSLTVLPAGPAANADSRDPFYLGVKQVGATVNQALNFGYNFIYQRYFAVPSTNTNGTWSFGNTAFYPNGLTSDLINHRKYGARAARLPHILNGYTCVNQTNAGGFLRNYSNADWGVRIPQDTPVVGTALLDITDLKAIQHRYTSVQRQNYFAAFYNDVVKEKWHTHGVNTDADPRPDYLGRSTHFMSGQDVNGTDDATLGSFVGKTLDRVSFQMPRHVFPEHGNLWVLMLPRFPMIHTKEQHPLLATSQPTNKLILGDPQVWSAEKVVAFDPGAWMAGGSLWTPDVNVAQQPFGQEYRYQPNRVHPVFETIPGYPFSQWDNTNQNDWMYYKDNEYADTFQISQIGQAQAHLQVKATRYSAIPDPKASIFAGGS